MNTAFFTICSRNYLAYALTLQQSLKAHMPDTPFYIYLADAPLDPHEELGASIIPAEDLGLPDLLDMAFRYTVMEFNTAIKADCFLDLLTRRGFDAAVYLDPDILVFAPLAEVQAALEAGASAVLTPHILEPLPANARPGEAEILQSGTFNLGFAAFSGSQESLGFIRWWSGRLHSECYAAPDRGLFVDQKFVDAAPAFIEDLAVLRHPGYNVAYWNLAQRKVEPADQGWLVNGEPLVFFHFSGVVPWNRKILSSHLGTGPQAAERSVFALVHSYQDTLMAAGFERWSAIPYAFGSFRDGSPILPPMRRQPPAHGAPSDWFSEPRIDWWTSEEPDVDQVSSARVTRLMMGFWLLRPDLRAVFSLATVSGRRGLQDWMRRHGQKEYGIPEAFLEGLPPLRHISRARSLARSLHRHVTGFAAAALERARRFRERLLS